MRYVDHVHQPKYTGENRCLPCTILNAVLAVGISTLVTVGLVQRTPVGIAAAGGGATLLSLLALIWLRGYIIPRTPEFTKRYMPGWMLRWFGKSPDLAAGGTTISNPAADDSPMDIERTLLTAGVIEPCEETDDLCLSESFEEDWYGAIELVDEHPDPRRAMEAMGLDTNELDIERIGDAIVTELDGDPIGQWPSKSALRVDVASCHIMSEYVPDWATTSPVRRNQLSAALRVFLDTCPDGGPAIVREETVESCCASYDVVSVICSESGDRLLEQPVGRA